MADQRYQQDRVQHAEASADAYEVIETVALRIAPALAEYRVR